MARQSAGSSRPAGCGSHVRAALLAACGNAKNGASSGGQGLPG